MTKAQLVSLLDALESRFEELGAEIHHIRALVIASRDQLQTKEETGEQQP